MKKLFLFFTLLIVGITANAQYTPYNSLNYMKLLKVPPVGAVEDSVLVYDGSDGFVKMRPSSVLIGKATATKTGTVKTDVTEVDPVVYTKTTNDNLLELETTVSAGAVSGFALTNNGDGTVNIASGIAYLRATNDSYATIIKYPISAVTNLALTDNANNYVLVDYNGGIPTITVTTNASTINTQTNSLAYVIARVGNNLEYLNLVGQNVDPNAKLRIRFLNQEGIRRASGAVLGFSNRNLTLTSSVLFSGLIRINAVSFNTASPDTFTLAYNNGDTWTRTTGQTQINNTQYNVSGTLTTMANNTFRTDYVYLLPNNPSKLYVIMGTTTYGSLTLAKSAPRPSALPVELQVLGLEVGRLFIEKNNAAIAEVQSTFANDFIGASVPEHNALTGLQGGTSGEYNHLTNAQVALVNGAEQLTNKATDFTTVNNTLYPSVQAVKTYADGLVVGLLNDRGSYDASSNLYPSTGGSGTSGAILKGNLWAISVAGTLGGISVGIGDWVRALVDTPAQTAANWSVVEGNFGYVPANDANVIHTTGDETKTGVLTFNSDTGSTSDLTRWSKNGLTTSKVDHNGNITGVSFIKSGATPGNILLAGGADVTQSTFALSSGGTGYIQNQNASAQSADMWISGTGEFGNYLQALNLIAKSGSDGLVIRNYTGAGFGAIYPYSVTPNGFNPSLIASATKTLLNVDTGGEVAISIGTSEKLTIANTGAATFASTVTATSYTGGATLTGTPTAPTAPVGTNTTQIATMAAVQSVARPYKVYTALLTQSGTSAPTATVLENTLGGTVVWSRDSAGFYKATLSGAFTNNKTFISLKPYSAYNTEVKSSRLGANDIGVSTFNTSGAQADDIMVGAQDFEIRVYP